MSALMWEVRVAPGRLAELVEHVLAHVDASAQVYCSEDPDARVVVIDPTGVGPGEVPPELIARPAHAWPFERIR